MPTNAVASGATGLLLIAGAGLVDGLLGRALLGELQYVGLRRPVATA